MRRAEIKSTATAHFPVGPLKGPDTTAHRSSLGHLGRWCRLWLQQWTEALVITQSGETESQGKDHISAS